MFHYLSIRVTLALFLVVTFLSACAASGVPDSPALPPIPATALSSRAPVPTTTATWSPHPHPALLQALRFAPANAFAAYFTDWTLIKSYVGVADLTVNSPLSERRKLTQAMLKEQTTFFPFAIQFGVDPEVWSLDVTDVSWESLVRLAPMQSVYVLKFNDQFDIQPLLRHFEARGFQQDTYNGSTIFTHNQTPDPTWNSSSWLHMFNTTVLMDERVLICSSSSTDLHTALDTFAKKVPALNDDPATQDMAGSLGAVAAAVVRPGDAARTDLNVDNLLRMLQRHNQEVGNHAREVMGTSLDQLHAYNSLGFGYRYEQNRPIGIFVMHYARVEDSRADLAPRRDIAEHGISLGILQPYSPRLLSVETVVSEEHNLVMRLRPSHDVPGALFSNVLTMRDMFFAATP
jgi:hypothetical protein